MGTGGPLGGALPSRCAKASKRDAPGGAGGSGAAAGRGARAAAAMESSFSSAARASGALDGRFLPCSFFHHGSGASRFEAFAHREGSAPPSGPPVPMGRAEAMIAQAAPPEAPELCDVPCTVDAARTKCTRSFHGVKVAFAFDTPLTPQQNVMQRVVKAILKRETALLESPTARARRRPSYRRAWRPSAT